MTMHDETSGPVQAAPGLRIEKHASVGSTNTLCFERAREGDPGDLWIVSEEQTAGRGRRGRPWTSNRGNMFASLLLIDPQPADRVAELPLVAAVALAEAIDKVTGSYHLGGLKWPNDVLVEGAKISGILLEAEMLPDGRRAIVLGIGVNCVSHPELSLYASTDLAALGYQVQPEGLFEALSQSIARWREIWAQERGFEQVRDAWVDRSVHQGKMITVRNGEREIEGRFLGLDGSGHLVLGTGNGKQETVYAGDVFFNEG